MATLKNNFAWDKIKWKNQEETFNSNSITIERMFSKMQNCTSFGSVGFLHDFGSITKVKMSKICNFIDC